MLNEFILNPLLKILILHYWDEYFAAGMQIQSYTVSLQKFYLDIHFACAEVTCTCASAEAVFAHIYACK